MRSSRGGGPRTLGLDLRKWGARFVINVAAIYAAVLLVPGISVDGWKGVLLAGAIFGLVNSFVKPLVKRLTCPLYILSLGLFALVVNAAMLALTAWISGQTDAGFRVDNAGSALAGGLITGVVSFLVSLVL